MSNTSGCAYTDGPQYVGCRVADKGWPMPQSGGKKSRSNKKCAYCGKRRTKGHSCGKKSMCNKKHSQRKSARKSKKYRKSRKSRKH